MASLACVAGAAPSMVNRACSFAGAISRRAAGKRLRGLPAQTAPAGP